ncbi:MAG: hypothetical protein O7G85_01070, partial [Planctomycetota bacterium]|nr:hypothetical protein [Planctomycetota bacterium]
MNTISCMASGVLIVVTGLGVEGGGGGGDYRLTELGALGGGCSWASEVNNARQVIGQAWTGEGVLVGFIWDALNGMRALDDSGITHNPYLLSEAGHVSGTFEVAGLTRALYWDETNGLQDLGTLGGDETIPYALNDVGQIVGQSRNAAGQWRAFLWDAAGGLQPLVTFFDESFARDINNNGLVVGSQVGSDGISIASRWIGTTFFDYPISSPSGSDLLAVNELGDMVGWKSKSALDITPIGVMKLQQFNLQFEMGLETFGPSKAYFINDHQIVGGLSNFSIYDWETFVWSFDNPIATSLGIGTAGGENWGGVLDLNEEDQFLLGFGGLIGPPFTDPYFGVQGQITRVGDLLVAWPPDSEAIASS